MLNIGYLTDEPYLMLTIPKSTDQKQSGASKKSPVAATDDTLRHLAFDNSLQANIISLVSSGNILIVNNAACKLLGYSKKELLTKNRADIFDTNESSFKKMLKQRTAEGQSRAFVTAIKKSGNPFPCEITSAVFMDKHGIENAITTIGDMSQSMQKQKNIDTKNEKIVADNIVLAKSRQKGIDIKKEKIVADNIVLAKSKQKNIDIKKRKIVADNIVLAKSKQKNIDTKKDKIVADNIVLAKSKQKNIDIKKDKIVADNIILAQAKSDEEKLEQGIAAKAEYSESFKLIFNSSSDVLFDSDLVANEFIISDAFEKEFGYKITNHMTPEADWISHIHPDDKEAMMQDYLRMLVSEDTEWKYSYRFLRADGSVANVISSRIILRNADGKAYRMIGSMQDISKQKVLEEKLEQEIKLKEKKIAEAMEDAKDTERSDIGRELHDNITQLLGVSKLYLDMAKSGGENSEMYLSRSSEYTITAIEEIRKLSKELTADAIKTLGLREAIENITRDTMEVNPVKISCALKSFIEHSVNDKFKHNVYRIVQEQLNNILKYAKATEVTISLSQNKNSIELTISDNGVGFDTSKKRKGIGIDNIKSRVSSYNGTADFVSQPGQGCILTATFPVTDTLVSKN